MILYVFPGQALSPATTETRPYIKCSLNARPIQNNGREKHNAALPYKTHNIWPHHPTKEFTHKRVRDDSLPLTAQLGRSFLQGTVRVRRRR